MTKKEREFWAWAARVVGDIRFRDWTIGVYRKTYPPDEEHPEGRQDSTIYLQVLFFSADNWSTGEKRVLLKGRKWMLSPHMTKSEIVQTALKAVLACVEHEAREQFFYKALPVYGPHIDVDSLVSACLNYDVRKEESDVRI